MRFRRWLLSSLIVVSAGCEPAQEESPVQREKPPAQVRAERLAEERGFDLREVALVQAPEGEGARHELHFQGVPVWGLGAKTAHGLTHFTNARFAPAARVETEPRLTRAQAEATALEALKDPSGRVEATHLMLLPREERRRRPDAPTSGHPNAEHFERVVTDLTLIYRVELSTGEAQTGWRRGWMARVDARSGQVLRLEPLVVHFDPSYTYRRASGYGVYKAGTTALTVRYEAAENYYWLADQRGNEYFWTYEDPLGRYKVYEPYGSPDASFGNGQLFSRSSALDSPNAETAAVDAYYSVNMTWDFYQTLLGRNGPGGTGKGMYIRVHYPWANAGYSFGSGRSSLELGYRTYPATSDLMYPMTTTDIVGHELGHDFFMKELVGNPAFFLSGYEELSSLNEGSGDISGFMTELSRDTVRAGRPLLNIDQTPPQSSNFLIAEETGALVRNLLRPLYPEWFPDIGRGDSHHGGGPFARMFLLLAYGCQSIPPGGSPTTDWNCRLVPGGFTGVGPLTAARIWARTVESLPQSADYLQARNTALAAAAAMDGVYGGPLTRKVGSAFAAINVGFAPDSNPPQTTLSCQQVAQDLECTGTISDAETPNQAARPPVLVVDGGAQTHTLPGWQFTYRIPGPPLAAGSHTLQLKAWDAWNNEATRSVTVNLDKAPPTAWVTRSGLPKQPLLFVSANDPAGILSVNFLIGIEMLAEVEQPPYQHAFDTSTWPDGIYPVVIDVYDRYWNLVTLNYPLQVDNTPPAVALAVGADGPPFTVTATVADVSPLARVDFKVDGVLFASPVPAGSSFQVEYAPLDPLAHNLRVEVTDAFGNVGVAMQAAPLDRKPPDVTFSVAQPPAGVKVTVAVSDTCSIQYPFALYLDGTLKAQPSTPDYVLDLGTTLEPGEHELQALVRDGCGNTADVRHVFTKSISPPVISSILRDDSQPRKPKFTVQCTDTDGVHHVEVRKGGTILLSDSTAPYEFVVDTTSWEDGSYTLEFHCSDIHGAASDLETLPVTADNSGPSILSFTVYGAGRSYYVLASGVSDLRGVQSVTLSAGLVGGFNVTVPQAPYGYQWLIPGTYPIQQELPFYATAKDRWGNETGLTRWCYVNTASIRPVYLSCRPPF